MTPPRMLGVIERRLLVNYRIEPVVAARLLPAPLRSHLVNGWSVAGICLIRLGHLRPRGVPASLGLRSENAAHRIAVEWDTPDGIASGVYIPRRDSASLVTVMIGGRLFPGEHHRARFDVRESDQHLRVAFTSTDRTTHVDVRVHPSDRLPPSALFADVDEASAFFRTGSCGYSAAEGGRHLDGLELHTDAWQVQPVEIDAVESSFIDALPVGTATIDCALLMRDVPVTWSPLPPMPVTAAQPIEPAAVTSLPPR